MTEQVTFVILPNMWQLNIYAYATMKPQIQTVYLMNCKKVILKDEGVTMIDIIASSWLDVYIFGNYIDWIGTILNTITVTTVMPIMLTVKSLIKDAP